MSRESPRAADPFALERYIDELRDAAPHYVYGFDIERKYVRIWKKHPGSDFRSVVAFYDESTGDLYRADSWKKRGRLLRNLVRGFDQFGNPSRDRRPTRSSSARRSRVRSRRRAGRR